MRTPDPRPCVTIHSDGACNHVTREGGFAALLNDGANWMVLHAPCRDTTNMRMELQGALTGLQALDTPCEVTLISDSKYVVDGASKWLPNWRQNNWCNSKGKPVDNRDLWEKLEQELARHRVRTVWCRGHNGDPGNELVDWFAARDAGTLKE